MMTANYYDSYNFALFEAVPEDDLPKKNGNTQVGRELKLVRKKRSHVKREMRVTFRRALALVLLCAMLFTPIISFVHARVQLDNISREINRTKALIAEQQSEKTRLTAELNSLMTIDRIEDYAENVLGMVKVGPYNIEYYDFSGEDAVVLSGGRSYDGVEEPSFIDKLLSYLF